MKRPYRLWNATTKRQLRWRYYALLKNAHNAALIEARWAKVGTTIEVIHAGSGKMHGQYTRKPTTVTFLGEKHGATASARRHSTGSNTRPPEAPLH